MTIGLQAYLQGYMHEKTAAVGLDPNKPIPPNIQQHLSPWTGETPRAEYAPGTWGGDGTYYSGRTINDPNLEFQRRNQPQGLTKGQQERRAAALREQKKQWWNPKRTIKGIRDTAAGAVSDLYRLGAGIHGPYSQALPNHPSAVGDIKEQAQYLAEDPIRNTKQMLKDMIAGPGGFWNVVTAGLGGSLASKLRKRKLDPRRVGAYRESTKGDVLPVTDPRRVGAYRESTKGDVLPVPGKTVKLKRIPKRRADTAAPVPGKTVKLRRRAQGEPGYPAPAVPPVKTAPELPSWQSETRPGNRHPNTYSSDVWRGAKGLPPRKIADLPDHLKPPFGWTPE